MLQLNDGPSGRLKVKSIRRAADTDHSPVASVCDSSSGDALEKPPC